MCPLSQPNQQKNADRFVLIVSSLGVGAAHNDRLSLLMLTDFITGNLGADSVCTFFCYLLRFPVFPSSGVLVYCVIIISYLRHD